MIKAKAGCTKPTCPAKNCTFEIPEKMVSDLSCRSMFHHMWEIFYFSWNRASLRKSLKSFVLRWRVVLIPTSGSLKYLFFFIALMTLRTGDAPTQKVCHSFPVERNLTCTAGCDQGGVCKDKIFQCRKCGFNTCTSCNSPFHTGLTCAQWFPACFCSNKIDFIPISGKYRRKSRWSLRTKPRTSSQCNVKHSIAWMNTACIRTSAQPKLWNCTSYSWRVYVM